MIARACTMGTLLVAVCNGCGGDPDPKDPNCVACAPEGSEGCAGALRQACTDGCWVTMEDCAARTPSLPCTMVVEEGSQCAIAVDVVGHISTVREAYFDPDTTAIPVMLSWDADDADYTESLMVFDYAGQPGYSGVMPGQSGLVALDSASGNDLIETCGVCLLAWKKVENSWRPFMPYTGTAELTIPSVVGGFFQVKLENVELREIEPGSSITVVVEDGLRWRLPSVELTGAATWYHCDLMDDLFGGTSDWTEGGRYCVDVGGSPRQFEIWGSDDVDADGWLELHKVQACDEPTPRCTGTPDAYACGP